MPTTSERLAVQTTRYRAVHFDAQRGAHGAYIEVEVTRGKDANGATWQISSVETGATYRVRSASQAAKRDADKTAGASLLAWNSDRANTGPFRVSHTSSL